MEKFIKQVYDETIVPGKFDVISQRPKHDVQVILSEPYAKKLKLADIKKELTKMSMMMMLGSDVKLDINLVQQLMESKTLSEKRVGCLFASMLLNSRPDLISSFTEIITSFFIDQKNDKIVCLALSVLSCCITKEIATELGHFIADAATSPLSSEETREKALLTLAAQYSKTGVYSSVEEVIPKITTYMQSSNMSLSSCACSVALAILRGGIPGITDEVFRNATIVVSAVILDSKVKKHYFVDDIPAPMTMMKLFQLLRYRKNWEEAELMRMSDLLAKLIVMRKKSRSEQGEAAFFMIFSEAAITLSRLPIQKKVYTKLTQILLDYVGGKNQTLYGFSLKALNILALKSQEIVNKIFHSRGALLKIIYSKKRPFDEIAFNVLYNASKGNERVAESVLLSTISYIPPYLMSKAQVYCAEIIMRNPNLNEVIPRSVDMLLKGTAEFANKMWPKVAAIIMKQENNSKQNMEACLQTLSANPHCNEGFVRLTAFLAGQYGHLCDCGGNAVIEVLVQNYDLYTGYTQAMIITAMTKLSTRIPELRMPAIDYLYDHLSSQSLEVVQRCREGALLTNQEILLKKTLQTPKFTGITYSVAPQPQAFNPFGVQPTQVKVAQPVPPQSLASHIRKPSEGQWNPGLIDVKRKGSDHVFEIPTEELPEETNAPQPPPIRVIDDVQEDSDDNEINSLLTTTTMSTFDTGFTDTQARKILEQFRTNTRGVIYEGEDYKILGMVELKGTVASLVYKIQSFSSIPMSVDKFEVKDHEGLEFAFGDRPNVIDPNGYVLIRDNVRPINVFSSIPIIHVSVGGWSASAPVPILPFMWSSPIAVDQQTFVARWKALAESSTKVDCTNCKDPTENGVCKAVKSAFNIDKLEWSPQGRPAFMGGFKTASGSVGFMLIFSFNGSSVSIEARTTKNEVAAPITTLLQNELSLL